MATDKKWEYSLMPRKRIKWSIEIIDEREESTGAIQPLPVSKWLQNDLLLLRKGSGIDLFLILIPMTTYIYSLFHVKNKQNKLALLLDRKGNIQGKKNF